MKITVKKLSQRPYGQHRVYDPAVVEAFLHPPNSGQERADDGSFGDEKVL